MHAVRCSRLLYPPNVKNKEPMNPTIVCCTTCKGREQHIEETLPKNIRDNPSSNIKFVLVNYASPYHLNDYLRTKHAKDIESGKLVTYDFRTAGPFRMAHAKNLSHRLSILEGADILVNLDADNFTGEGFADHVSSLMSDNTFLYSKMIKDVTPRGITGRIAVRPDTFLKVGGYDEKFGTWSPDDKDFNKRLRKHGCIAKEIDTRFLKAVLHNDKMRFKEYPNMEAKGWTEDFAHIDKVVVNGGRFGMGIVYRNFSDEPTVLGPVPTRIFGIGMHKTATTSLHHALCTLGFNSAHWKSAPWARRIWEEMNEFGLSRTLEQHYALCDLPIPLLYGALDLAYPGSKFILTVRDENKWMESIRNHWSDKNLFRSQWDADGFTHRIHTALYGRRTFDHRVFLARYRRHNAEVLTYFKNRPNDLLVMNMDGGAGWNELCSFFNVPTPNVSYPVAFATARVICDRLSKPF